LQAASLRLGKTAVLAPDDGVISARSATVGSLTQPGQELFRLIRGGRLEWRADVPSADLARVQPGMPATLTSPAGQPVTARCAPWRRASIRRRATAWSMSTCRPPPCAPACSPAANSNSAAARPSPCRRRRAARGFAYLFRLEGEDRVVQTKVALGRRNGERVEVLSGLPAGARVVESGAGFLADGDAVKVAAQ
jgi:multidrug efflux pump subunit AcrA (membrane-fusion protein)